MEVVIIGNFYYINFVWLWGFCLEGVYWFFVYEFMVNGFLD